MVGMQFFDILCAYDQSLYANYISDWHFLINDNDTNVDLKIAVLDLFDQECQTINIDKFDLILLCNRSEPLHVFNQALTRLLNHDKVYILSNSYLEKNHIMKEKVIWFPFCVLCCHDYWSRAFYPQMFNNARLQNQKRNNKLIAINGQNRAHRHYFFSLLTKSNSDIKIVSNLHNKKASKLLDSAFECQEDCEFRDFVNSAVSHELVENSQNKLKYYQSPPKIGINGKFGSLMPGFTVMKEYFEYACVIFPESGWQNNELTATEKIAKCLYAESIPFPIGGSNINYLYNELGYQTAWNLLPKDLQKFDKEKNHSVRYRDAVKAIEWLDQNRNVFSSEHCHSMRTENKKKFFANSMAELAVKKFHQKIVSLLKQLQLDKNKKSSII